MASQQFFLRWDNYSNYISYAFGTLRNQEDLVDVTLSCEGKKIRAHKVLLSACSTYFRDVFKDNPCQHPVIVFKNVRFDDLLAIVEFMYQGEVSVVQDSLSSFLNTAELLSVQGLTEGGTGGGGGPSPNTTTTVIDTLTMPKTVTLKTQPVQQQQQQVLQQQQHHQTVTLVPATTTTDNRRYAKKVYPGQATATTIKTVTHPITVFSPKTNNSTTTATTTKRFVANPVKQMTANAPPTLTALVTSDLDAVNTASTNTDGHQLQQQTLNTNASAQPSQVKRKRILFDSEENISIEDVNYVKQQMDSMEMPDYIEIQTTGEDGQEKSLVTVTAEDLMSGAEEGDHQENVIIEETYEGGQGDDEDDDKDKEMEITYTKDEQGNGTVVLTPVHKDGDKSQSVKFVQADGTNTKWSQCSYCKLVITSVNLWRHVRTQHTAQQPQVCQYCQKNFKNKYSLREHIRIAHEKLTRESGETQASGKDDDMGSTTDTELVVLKSEK